FLKTNVVDPIHQREHQVASQSSQHQLPSPSLPPVTTATIPRVIPTLPLLTVIPADTTPLRHYTRRVRIAQSSALPPINSLNARIKLLEDKDRGVAEQSRDDALIKGRSLDEGEEAPERVNDDT
nr:hypothetical protein [Tanacetum cinerariifolium]